MNSSQVNNNEFMQPKNSFLEEWTLLFGSEVNLDEIQRHCFEGKLRDSRLRSVIWRILLKVLPLDRQEWIKILNHSRKSYENIKTKLNTNPRCSNNDDPDYNNPLSLQNENPWKQFFLDEELRDDIRKDVDRTFPDLQFFQSSKTRQIMSDILFVYGKQNSHVAYRQGFHEIVGVLVFSIYFDHRSFEHLTEQNCLEELNAFDVETLQVLNDPRYLEHDAYSLFQQLMMLIEGWFITDSEFSNSPTVLEETELFSSKDNPNSELLRRLDYINEELLSKIDPILYRHLRSMEITVQIFGIRWLRLLFIREFHLHDLLFLWDVILSDRPILNLVDYVFLGLLIQIRDLLLHSDYSASLQYLMRFPPIADIYSFIQLVLHLKFPRNYPKPKNCALPVYSNITLAGATHPNQNREVFKTTNSTTNGNGSGNVKKSASMIKNKPVDILLNKLGSHALSASPPSKNTMYFNPGANVPAKIPSKIEGRSKFYFPADSSQNNNLNAHVFDLQNRTRQAVNRIRKASENLEQQGLPEQGPIIIELRDIASLLNEGLITDQEESIMSEAPQQIPTRSNSISKPVRASSRSNSISIKGPRELELVELHFSKLKNF